MAPMVKNLTAMQETRVQSLGQDNPLEKGMATHSSILARRIPWTKDPGRLQSLELLGSAITELLKLPLSVHSAGYIISFPFSLCLLLLFLSAIYNSSLDNHFAFLHFFFFEMVLVTDSYTML